MAVTVVTQQARYERVQLTEADFEALIRSQAQRLFPDARWFDFKPPIRSVHGVAHPDAAIFSATTSDWWVVEVELARHSVYDHVELQLLKLRDGWYGPSELAYITDRHSDAGEMLARVDARRPKHLLILDDTSGPIERVADEMGYDVMHILPFVSGRHLFATTIQARHPFRRRRPPGGVALALSDDAIAARLVLQREDQNFPVVDFVVVSGELRKAFLSADARSVVLAMSRQELVNLTGGSTNFVLSVDPEEPNRLTPVRTGGVG